MYVPTKEDLNKKTNTLSLLNRNLQDLILDCQVSIPRIHEGTEEQVVTDKMIFLSAILYFFFGKDMKLSPFQIVPGHHLCIEAITFNRNDRFTACSDSDDDLLTPEAHSDSEQTDRSNTTHVTDRSDFKPTARRGTKRKA